MSRRVVFLSTDSGLKGFTSASNAPTMHDNGERYQHRMPEPALVDSSVRPVWKYPIICA
jgi:hypothetical protein